MLPLLLCFLLSGNSCRCCAYLQYGSIIRWRHPHRWGDATADQLQLCCHITHDSGPDCRVCLQHYLAAAASEQATSRPYSRSRCRYMGHRNNAGASAVGALSALLISRSLRVTHLQHQHALFRIGRQPVGQHTAGGAGAHHYVVEILPRRIHVWPGEPLRPNLQAQAISSRCRPAAANARLTRIRHDAP